MAIRHGRNAGIYVNGVDISGDLNAVSAESEQELADITTFGHIGHSSYPGLARDSGTIEALYNSTEKTVFEGMIQLTPSYAMMLAFGQALGDPAYATEEIMLKSNSMKSVVTDINKASFSFDVDNYPFEESKLLSTGKQTVAAASTGQGTTLDNGSASGTTGGAGYLQVFSVTGGTLTISIQTSSTGTFGVETATTATFSAASTSGTERKAVSTQIYRYARAAWVATGSTCSFALALKRY